MAKITSTQLACPACGEHHNQVIDVRSRAGEPGLRRRRRCFACGHKWTTVEITTTEYRQHKERVRRTQKRVRLQLLALERVLTAG